MYFFHTKLLSDQQSGEMIEWLLGRSDSVDTIEHVSLEYLTQVMGEWAHLGVLSGDWMVTFNEKTTPEDVVYFKLRWC